MSIILRGSDFYENSLEDSLRVHGPFQKREALLSSVIAFGSVREIVSRLIGNVEQYPNMRGLGGYM